MIGNARLVETNSAKIAEIPDEAEIERLVATIDVSSPMSIMAFGGELADRTTSYADELLQSARMNDLDEVGSKLSAIVAAAAEFRISSLDNKWSRTPLIGPVLKRIALGKVRAVSHFDTVKGQIDSILSDVESTTRMLERRSNDFQAMYEGVREEHQALSSHVTAIEYCLARIDRERSEIVIAGDNLEASERAAALDASQNALRKRADDLRALQHAALQTLPMVRVMQANNIALIDKFNTVQKLTLPAWKRTFLMALTLEEQKDSVNLANTIDDATNTFMKRNADLLHHNSVATAKANQRLVVDIETLRHMHEKVLQTLDDVRDAHKEGAAARAAALEQLTELRAELVGATREARSGNT